MSITPPLANLSVAIVNHASKLRKQDLVNLGTSVEIWTKPCVTPGVVETQLRSSLEVRAGFGVGQASLQVRKQLKCNVHEDWCCGGRGAAQAHMYGV